MINKELTELGEKLTRVLEDQKKVFDETVEKIQNEEQKKRLKDLMRRASSGNVDAHQAQKEIEEILKNAN